MEKNIANNLIINYSDNILNELFSHLQNNYPYQKILIMNINNKIALDNNLYKKINFEPILLSDINRENSTDFATAVCFCMEDLILLKKLDINYNFSIILCFDNYIQTWQYTNISQLLSNNNKVIIFINKEQLSLKNNLIYSLIIDALLLKFFCIEYKLQNVFLNFNNPLLTETELAYIKNLDILKIENYSFEQILELYLKLILPASKITNFVLQDFLIKQNNEDYYALLMPQLLLKHYEVFFKNAKINNVEKIPMQLINKEKNKNKYNIKEKQFWIKFYKLRKLFYYDVKNLEKEYETFIDKLFLNNYDFASELFSNSINEQQTNNVINILAEKQNSFIGLIKLFGLV